MKLSDLKPRLFKKNGRWYCEAAEGRTQSGESPLSAFTQWRLHLEMDRLKERMDSDRRLPFRPLDYPLLPQFYPQQPQRVREYWEGFPPGTVFCRH
jgi:hypothetical protein